VPCQGNSRFAVGVVGSRADRVMFGGRCDGELLLATRNQAPADKLYRTRDEVKADVFDYIERFLQSRMQALEQSIT
jgi:hypothetical protein